MKKLNYLLMCLIIFSSMIFYSCDTDTPTSADHENPEIQSIVLYNAAENDTLYGWYRTDSTFVNFTDTLEMIKSYNLDISVSDNGNLHQVVFFVKDAIGDSIIQLQTQNIPDNGEINFVINASYFPAIQDSSLQQYYLYFSIYDDTDNSVTSPELGFDVEKIYLQEKLYNEFGLLWETNEAVADIDFRNKVGKLTFIQFLANG